MAEPVDTVVASPLDVSERETIIARQVAIAQYIVEATAANQEGVTEEAVNLMRLGAYTALWCVLFQGPGKLPDFPDGDRDAQDEVNARLAELGVTVTPSGGVS